MASRKEELVLPRAARGTSSRRSDGWVTVTSRKVFRSEKPKVRTSGRCARRESDCSVAAQKSKPLQLTAKLIAKLVVSLSPRARVAEARGSMFTFRVIPTSGMPSAATTVAARPPLRVQGESQPEAS